MECYGGVSVGYGLRVDYCGGKIIGAVKVMSGEGPVRQIGELTGVFRDLDRGGKNEVRGFGRMSLRRRVAVRFWWRAVVYARGG